MTGAVYIAMTELSLTRVEGPNHGVKEPHMVARGLKSRKSYEEKEQR